MRYLIILSALVMMIEAQRPSYASSGPIGRPGLASRFKTDSASSTTTVAVENRIGEDGSTQKIPVDARGDVNLVNRLNSWDRDHQPFWLLNADHIERARNTTRGTPQTGQNQATQQTTQLNNRNQVDFQRTRDSFDGSSQRRQGFQENQDRSQGRRGGFSRTQDSDQRNSGSFLALQERQMYNDLTNRARYIQENSQDDEIYNGRRNQDRPSRYEYRKNFRY